MKERLEALRDAAFKEIQDNIDLNELEELRVKFLGKKGEITKILRDMGKLSAETVSYTHLTLPTKRIV